MGKKQEGNIAATVSRWRSGKRCTALKPGNGHAASDAVNSTIRLRRSCAKEPLGKLTAPFEHSPALRRITEPTNKNTEPVHETEAHIETAWSSVSETVLQIQVKESNVENEEQIKMRENSKR